MVQRLQARYFRSLGVSQLLAIAERRQTDQPRPYSVPAWAETLDELHKIPEDMV